MKLGKHEFARLIGFIQKVMITKEALSSFDIEDIDNMIDFDVPMAEKQYVSADQVNQLMMLMVEGTRKIEAIKMHRTLTGYGLKESKDAVEKYWMGKPQEPATLSDILHSAGRNKTGNDISGM